MSLKNKFQTLPFSKLFESNPILVPIPKSSLKANDTLWVPKLLALAIHKRGYGSEVTECIHRVTPLKKSATSYSKDRPKAFDHYRTIEIRNNLISNPKEILLVDDIITRGATLLGAANRISMAFPDAKISSFAAIRTVSPPDTFTQIFDSRIGRIALSNGDTFRRP